MAGTLIACGQGEATFDKAKIKADITNVLKTQDAAWNRGDIDAFMEDYWKSEELRFASAGNINRGWQATLDGYKTRYPDKATMGELSFTDLEIKVLSPKYAQVFGRWSLKREKDNPGGLFTLLFEKRGGKWLIVSDHTSSNSN
ncbi:MAG: nuclear transport factor 2 family protein [Hyphomonadaceae bacterium]|nr:nuclear transport factor 2 family protein [Hyphomonadaceae bacterium]